MSRHPVKNWILPVLSVALTLVVSLGLLRWLAPGLLGVPVDLQMVRVKKEVPPFFDGVFRKEDYKGRAFIIKDPHIIRAKPLVPYALGAGPHDILGFRNTRIPNVADVVTIGDSQTYGNNALFEENWPSRLESGLVPKAPVFYNMPVGGWCALEYLQIVKYAVLFRPRIIIVAFYSGNDPLESFIRAYSQERWQAIRPDPSIEKGDAPSLPFPPGKQDQWKVAFSDGTETVFTPRLRLAANEKNKVCRAGYAIMADAASRISRLCAKHHIELVFALIPTKELAFAEKVRQEKI